MALLPLLLLRSPNRPQLLAQNSDRHWMIRVQLSQCALVADQRRRRTVLSVDPERPRRVEPRLTGQLIGSWLLLVRSEAHANCLLRLRESCRDTRRPPRRLSHCLLVGAHKKFWPLCARGIKSLRRPGAASGCLIFTRRRRRRKLSPKVAESIHTLQRANLRTKLSRSSLRTTKAALCCSMKPTITNR